MLRWLELRRGSKISELLENHINLVTRCVQEAEKGIEKYVKGQVEDANQHLTLARRKESEADEIRRKIVEEVEWGKLNPEDREDLLHVTRRMDSVANWTKEAVRILSLINPSNIPEELKSGIVEMAKLNTKGVELLNMAIKSLSEDPRKAIKFTQEVDRIESKADERDLENRRLLSLSTELRFQDALILLDFLHALEEASDAEEDAADYVKGIAVRKL